MAVCVPVKDLKNTADFTETVRNAGVPVTVTKNGREAFVSMTPEYYEFLRMEAARAHLYQVVDRAEEDIAAGRIVDARASQETLKDRYGL